MKRIGAPTVLPLILIGDEPQLLARLIARLSRNRSYLPILDGPRLTRSDVDAEVVRRTNTIARLRCRKIIFAGLPEETVSLFDGKFPRMTTAIVKDEEGLDSIVGLKTKNPSAILDWGPQRIGIGLLEALRTGTRIAFSLSESPAKTRIDSGTRNLVVCEEGDDFAQIVAANYCYALDASLMLIPEVPSAEADSLLERLYSLYAEGDSSPAERLELVVGRLRELAGPVPIPTDGCITFVTKSLPWGLAFHEVPTSHLFSAPDLSISIANAVAAERSGKGVRVAALVDPGSVDATEIALVASSLATRGVFVRGFRGAMASVTRVSAMVELFPYDILLISTHCGDVSGWRWTYEFRDREGLERVLVVDIAIGVGQATESDKVLVTQYVRFVSLDGVDWNDEEGKRRLYIGYSIIDYAERSRDFDTFRPTKRERIARVFGSAALRMHDNNYVPVPASLAADGTPIVVNNACGSWHRLASTFSFGNARAYIGTLYDVLDIEAALVMKELLEKEFSKPLAVALWNAQRRVWGASPRRPYAMVGCHFQRVISGPDGAPIHVASRLRAMERAYVETLKTAAVSESDSRGSLGERLAFIRFELNAIETYIAKFSG